MDRFGWAAFGAWVEQHRQARGLSVYETARQTRVSVAWLSQLRAGGRVVRGQWKLPEPKPELLARLAITLSIPVEDMWIAAGLPPPTQGLPNPDMDAGVLAEDLYRDEQERWLDDVVEPSYDIERFG